MQRHVRRNLTGWNGICGIGKKWAALQVGISGRIGNRLQIVTRLGIAVI